MNEFEIIKNFFSKLSLNNKSSLFLNDDVFFDRSKKLVISVDTYINKSHFFDFKDPNLVIKKIGEVPSGFILVNSSPFSEGSSWIMTLLPQAILLAILSYLGILYYLVYPRIQY